MKKNYYFDSSATSNPKPKVVIDTVIEAISNFNENPGRGISSGKLNLERKIFNIRENLNQFFNGNSPLCFAFTKNSTESLNFAIKGLNLENCHIITSVLEHNSSLRPLNYLKNEKNITLSYLKPHENSDFMIAELEGLITDKTRAVVINHISNLTGYIFDIEKIGRLCHDKNLIFIVDASQSAGFIPIDIKKSYIDILCFTGHKSLFAIQGIGGIYVDENISISPIIEGGTGSYSKMERQPLSMPEVLEAGTLNVPGILSLGAGLDFIKGEGLDKIRSHEENLTTYFLENLRNIKEIQIHDDFNIKRGPVVSLNMKNISPSDLGDLLSEEFNISIRSGFHCAPLAHKYLSTYETGSVRFSFGYFNTLEEVDYALNALKEIKNYLFSKNI